MKKRLGVFATVLSCVLILALGLVGCMSITSYSIKFMDEDGNQIGVTQMVEEGQELKVEVPPEKDGYLFDGWFLDGKLYDFDSENAKKVNKDMTFIARYSEEKYTVSFYFGDKLIQEKKVKKGDKVAPVAFDEPGYNFNFWAEEGKSTAFNFNAVIKGDLKLVANVTESSFVTIKINGEVTQTLKVTKDGGMEGTINEPEHLWMYSISRDGVVIDGIQGIDFDKLTANTTIEYSYYGEGKFVKFGDGQISMTGNQGECPRQYFNQVSPTDGFGGQYSVNSTAKDTGLGFAITDGTNVITAFVMNNSTVRYTTTTNENGYASWEDRKTYNGLDLGLSDPLDYTIKYCYKNGALALYTDSDHVVLLDNITKGYKGDQKDVATCLDENATWQVGFWLWNNDPNTYNITDLQVVKGVSQAVFECFKGNHTDEDGDGKCDHCGNVKVAINGKVAFNGDPAADLSGTVLKFKNIKKAYEFADAVKADGEFNVDLWQGTYSVVAENAILNCSANLADIKVDGTTEPIELVLLPVIFSGEVKNATVNGNNTSIKGNGYAYMDGSDKNIYLKVTLNITNPHQGITIYTDSVNGNNAQICFQHNGYSLFRNYTWEKTATGNVFSDNGLLGLKTDAIGEHTVEYFIIEGKLYVVYDGVNCFEKPLALSKMNAAFTADAVYHIGVYNFDKNFNLENTVVHEVKFGAAAVKAYDNVRKLFTDELKNATTEINKVSINGNGYAYLKGSGSASYLKVTLNITNPHQGITIYTDSVNGNNAQICFQHNGYSLFRNYTWEATATGNIFSDNGLLGLKTDANGEHIVEYFIIEGKLYVIYDGVNCFGNPLALSKLNAAFTADAVYHIGIYNFDKNFNLTNTVINEAEFGDKALLAFDSRKAKIGEVKNATVSGDRVTIKGNGYAYMEGSGNDVYLKVTLNITNPHQGITIYTDSVNGNNAQICFQNKGYSLFKNYTWATTATGNVFSDNGLLGMTTDANGEHTVEYFITGGNLYVIYDGVNCFDKPLVLSKLNAAFTADANYNIGVYNYDGNFNLTDTVIHEVQFGEKAVQAFNKNNQAG